jgi:hypothetical protein
VRSIPSLPRSFFRLLAAALLIGAPAALRAQARASNSGSVIASIVRPVARAGVKQGDIKIDGHIDEAAWDAAPVIKGFIESEPLEGVTPPHDTEVRILFDDEAMYVAARMWDRPDSIRKVLLRRDERGTFMDWFGFSIDPERDGRTGYEFRITAAGEQQDIYVSDDNVEDANWNAVWESAVASDDQGWMAEIRLPLSQIRYPSTGGVQTWAINLHRRRAANVELSHFSLESKRLTGLVSQFGSIEDVHVPPAVRHIEARPYVLSSYHNGPAPAGDPFFDGTETSGRIGSDFRLGLGSAFTFDATVNPDFGQVEADPAVINLTAFETRFEEKRPFFVEDAQVFNFGLSGGSNQLYYSRRIGRPPHLTGPGDADFLDLPAAATILGAAKLTGRTAHGLSVGGLTAVTGAESGRAFWSADQRLVTFRAEPRTEFGVASVKQDYRRGLSQIGAIVTGLHRDLPGSGEFNALPGRAFTAGGRFDQQWDDRRWKLFGFLAGSRVEGSNAALIALQRSSIHYFQRPDATRARVDSSATSMTGAEWRLELDRQNTKNWTGAVWTAGLTKGFDVNELGFSTNRERLDGGARLGYRELKARYLRDYNVSVSSVYNFSWEALDHASEWSSWRRAYTNGNLNFTSSFSFRGYQTGSFNLGFTPDLYSRTATRGGPVMIQPGNLNGKLGYGTDRRNATSVSGSVSWAGNQRNAGHDVVFDATLSLRPSHAIQVTVNPNLELKQDASQYVATYTPSSTAAADLPFQPTFGRRYLFGDLDQKTVGVELRANYTISPTLTFQMYAQPLLSSGDFTAYKQLSAASSFDFRRFTEGTATRIVNRTVCSGGSICRDDGGTEYVDFDSDGLPDYTFKDQDFNVRSLVGNAVLRWEYRPGSAVFVVWQRQQDDQVQVGDFRFGRDLSALMRTPAHNRFIVKVNYWLGL